MLTKNELRLIRLFTELDQSFAEGDYKKYSCTVQKIRTVQFEYTVYSNIWNWLSFMLQVAHLQCLDKIKQGHMI